MNMDYILVYSNDYLHNYYNNAYLLMYLYFVYVIAMFLYYLLCLEHSLYD
jgi:hypothetical protein